MLPAGILTRTPTPFVPAPPYIAPNNPQQKFGFRILVAGVLPEA